MNCKPGDLAVVINSRDCVEKIGLFVRVIRFAPKGSKLNPAWHPIGRQVASENDVWHVVHETTGREWLHSDCRLRPIRPGDLEDETPTVRELEAA